MKKYVKPEMIKVIPDFSAILQMNQTSSVQGPGEGEHAGDDDEFAKQRGIWGTDKNNLLW